MFAKYHTPPNECIGDIGHGQTTLHIAAISNCYFAVDAIITIINTTQPGNLGFFWTIPDSDDNTPIMTAVLTQCT